MNVSYRLFRHYAAREGRRFIPQPHPEQDARSPLWMRVTAAVMAVVMYFAPVVLRLDETVHAAPIVDPRAPVTFQPTITQTSTGVPAVNIAAPNANGLSVNQYRSFNVDSSGLVLNNSLVSGKPLLGGSLGANPNLNGRAATTILNQVTSTTPSTLAGPLEVFGSPATVIVSNPNGVNVNGLALTNAPGLVLTTGVPQFVTGPGGSVTSFDNAGALAYNVSSGNITINGPAGVNGPGAGIEGTVGNIDVIGQTVNLAAPLYANQTLNVIAGNQTVMPKASNANGTTYAMSNVGPGQPGAVAVDAVRYGSVTAGQVFIVSTAAGEGVNMQGPLAATAGNVVVTSSGDIAVGQTYANQNVGLTSGGNVAITDTDLANENYTVSANGEINASGSVSAGQDATLNAGGNLNAASVAANGNATLMAGNSMTVGSVSGQNLALQTGTGDLTIDSALSAPGTLAAKAGRDLTVNGAVTAGSMTTLTGARNAFINGAVASVGDAAIAAQTGSASVAGNVQTNGALAITAAQDATLGGTAQAQGDVSIVAAGGSISGQGKVSSSGGAVTLQAGQDIATTGSLQGGTSVTATAGRDASLGGTVTAPGAVTVSAGQDATLAGNAIAGSTLAVNAGRNVGIDGEAVSLGDMVLSAASGTLATAGDVTALGALAANGAQDVSVGGAVYGGLGATIGSSAGSVNVAGAITSPGTIAVNTVQDAVVTGAVHSGSDTAIAAGGNVALDGGLEVDGTGNATIAAGGNLTGSGSIAVANNTTLTAGNDLAVSGSIATGKDLTATAAQHLSTGAVTAVGNATLSATNGSATLAGDVLTGGNLAVLAGTDVDVPGSVATLGDLALDAQGGNLRAGGAVSSAGSATLNAGQNLALDGTTTVSQDATLTGTNIAAQTLAVGGNLNATASQNLDTTAGTLGVNGNATLTGATVTTGNTLVGGTAAITGTQSLTTTGTGGYLGDATLAGGTVTNTGTQMAAGTLDVSGSTVTNLGALSGLVAANVNATDFVNSGTLYAPTANLSVANSTTNTGALMATNALTLTTNSLSNAGGLVFAGDTSANPDLSLGDLTVNVNGLDGSFDNTGGSILGIHSATLNLPYQTIDPSSSAFGTVNGGAALNLLAATVNNTGMWIVPETAVNVTAGQISNAGTISQAGGSLALDGAVSNTGTVAANDLTITGSLANAANATVQAGDAFTLNGSGTNAGTVEALNRLDLSGTSYDNSNGVTQVGTSTAGTGDMHIDLSGDLVNAGGTITATHDLAITASNVINTGATAAGATTTTTTTIDDPTLLLGTIVGNETVVYPFESVLGIDTATQPLTLGDLLTPAGITTGWWVASGVFGSYVPNVPASQDEQVLTTPGINSVVINAQTTQPVATSGTVTFQLLWQAMGQAAETGDISYGGIYVIQDGTVPTTGSFPDIAPTPHTITVTLPTVTETVTTTGSTTDSSVIAAGHDLSLTANGLQNTGGTVSAGNDANVNVQSLENGAATYSSTVTDSVDAAALQAFMTALPYTNAPCFSWCNDPLPTLVGVRGSGNWNTNESPIFYTLYSPQNVVAPSVTSSVTVQGQAGQIVAGHNVNLSGGDLTNAGTIAAANDVTITASSFTNQGTNTGTTTTTAGCAAGFSAGCSSLSTTNPNSATYSYQQINANVTAGHDVVIAANAVANTYGNLLAGNNVVIGGAGTTASNPTQATSVTNTSGAIEAANDVNISAATLTNTIAAPAQVHQNYGSATPFTGCNGNCEAYVDVQSASPATITANHDVNLTAATFSNVGSLVTAQNNVTINAGSSASNSNQYLNSYWHANTTDGGVGFQSWGCAGNESLCASLYGGAYQSSQAQDPAGLPDAVGLPDFVPGTIQAGNTLSVTSPTLTNTGNVIGPAVTLTGSTLVNGLTDPNVYTPPPAVAGQVITLGPAAVPSTAATTVNAAGLVTNLAGKRVSVTAGVGLPANAPIGYTTVGKPVPPPAATTRSPSGTTVQTLDGQTLNVTYLLNSPASAVTNDLSPAALLAALPASLRPDTAQFYYDPYTQAQQVQQAALQATGQSSFYAMPSQTDATNQQSIANLDTAALYGAALQYAEQNNIALGTQLSQQQLAQVNAPMLWYVEETVPEPGCTASGSGTCPTVQALMPEVLLPQNFATVQADGTITGTDVALNYANSILNTGSISASGTLSVDTASLTNEQRSTNVGTIYQQVSNGISATTGTVVQEGGYMSAANYDLQVQSLNQIGGALQQLSAEGSVDTAGTQALLANLQAQLGSGFTQSTVSNDLQTSMVYTESSFGFLQVFALVAAVVVSVLTYGAASEAIGATLGAEGGTFAAATTTVSATGVLTTTTAGLGNIALSAGIAGVTSSVASQVISTGSVNWGSAFEMGAVAAITAGLANGITYDSSSGLGFSTDPLTVGGSTSSLAMLAGVQPNLGSGVVPTATSSVASLPEQALAIAGEAMIQAGVQEAIEGGSFLTALRNAAAGDVAAAGAFDIGEAQGSLNEAEYIAAHAALGCAAGAASGQGCGGGAIGGGIGAALNPIIDSNGNIPPAIETAITTMVGGSVAGALGYNVQGAVTAAENETLNNWFKHIIVQGGFHGPIAVGVAVGPNVTFDVGSLSVSTSPDVEIGVVGDVGASVGISGDDSFAGPATINVGLGKYLGIQITPSNTAAWNQLPWYDPSRYINAISAGIGAGVPYVPAIPGTISINPTYTPPGTGK